MRIAGWSRRGPALAAFARHAGVCAGLAGLALTSTPVATGAASLSPAPPAGAAPGSSLAAGVQARPAPG